MLSPESDEILDWRIGTPLGNCSEELTPLRETHGMIAIGEFGVILDFVTHERHLLVHIHDKAMKEILDNVVTNLKWSFESS